MLMPPQPYPTTDELLQQAASTVGMRRLVYSSDTLITLFLQSDRILAYRGEESTPFGFLRFGGPRSGAIWMNGEVIGEYDKNIEGEFVVVEVEDGFLAGHQQRQDPLDYLIQRSHLRSTS